MKFWQAATPKNVTLVLGVTSAVVNFPLAMVVLFSNDTSANSDESRAFLSTSLILAGATVMSAIAWGLSELSGECDCACDSDYTLVP